MVSMGCMMSCVSCSHLYWYWTSTILGDLCDTVAYYVLVTYWPPGGRTEMATSVDWRLKLASSALNHILWQMKQRTNSPVAKLDFHHRLRQHQHFHCNHKLSATEKDKYSQCSWGRANKYSIDCWGSLWPLTYYANVVVSPTPPSYSPHTYWSSAEIHATEYKAFWLLIFTFILCPFITAQLDTWSLFAQFCPKPDLFHQC